MVINTFDKNAEIISMFGNTSERNFFVDKSKSSDLQLEWNSSTHGSFSNTSILAYDSLVIISDLSGRITAFSVSTGKTVGELKYPGEIEQAPILLHSYLIFIVNELKETYSTLIVYDLVRKREIQTVKLNGRFNTEMLVRNNYCYFISDFGMLYKISRSGNIEWENDIGKENYSNPAADEKFLYLITVSGNLIKVNNNNGDVLYDRKFEGRFQSGISLDKDNAYFGNDDGIFYAINKETGLQKWSYSSGSRIVQTPGFDDENVYFGNLNGDIHSLNKKSAEINWVRNTNGLINTSPLIFNNIVIQPNLDKKIDILNKSTGELLNQLEFESRCRTAPIYFRDRLIVGVDKGEVYCYSFVENNNAKGK
jgi:eukaryotic-like serine/threonine-protein kinase